jgi:hypothetical protein
MENKDALSIRRFMNLLETVESKIISEKKHLTLLSLAIFSNGLSCSNVEVQIIISSIFFANFNLSNK